MMRMSTKIINDQKFEKRLISPQHAKMTEIDSPFEKKLIFLSFKKEKLFTIRRKKIIYNKNNINFNININNNKNKSNCNVIDSNNFTKININTICLWLYVFACAQLLL